MLFLSAACEPNVNQFVFSSTAAVYGNADVKPLSEDAVLAPMSPYGRSKLMSEQILRDASEVHDLSHVILRYFNVAGADPSGRLGQCSREATHLVKVALETALGRRSHMHIFGDDYPTHDGTCVRDYIHVSDLARAHLAALDHLRRNKVSLTLNCGYGRGYSVKQVIESVKKISGVDFEVRRADRRPGDPPSVVANSDKLKRLGWTAQHDDLAEIVRRAYNWERMSSRIILRGPLQPPFR